jgi:hypothetical protein
MTFSIQINITKTKKGVGGISFEKFLEILLFSSPSYKLQLYLYHMKYIIPNERLTNIIINYLDTKFTPDDGWEKEFYKEEVSQGYSLDFLTDDFYTFYYNDFYGHLRKEKVLQIETWVCEKLYNLFGKFWVPVFKQWFETNSGLEVKIVIYTEPTEYGMNTKEENF